MKKGKQQLPGYMYQDRLFGIFITLPAIILLALLFVFPVIFSFSLSFTDYNISKMAVPSFVGLRNYISIIRSSEFLNAVKVTFIITSGALSIQFVCGLTLAALVNSIQRNQGIFKTGYLIPMMIAPTVSGLLFRFMLNSEFGILNTMLKSMRVISTNIPWLTDLRLAVFCIMLVDSWSTIPLVFLLMYTALSGLSHTIIEAGRIDGASAFQIFFLIQLPCIRGPALVTLFLRFMDVFRIYDSIYVLTRGGPGTATESLSILIYKVNWVRYEMGNAASMSYIMMFIMFVIALGIQYFSYEKDERSLFKRRSTLSA
jgi:multiple sugar transport system permease protein